MDNLEGRTAIITGGGTGIGKAIAHDLARLRVHIVLCGRRHQPLLQTVDEIRNAGYQATYVQADVSVEADVDRVVRTAIDTYGGLDLVVNSAGVLGGAEIHNHNVDEWDRIMAINLRGPFLLARYVLPHMRARRRGHIINISSESGIDYYTGNGAYGVSKHALNALGEFILRENHAYGILVDTICPGMVLTEMTEELPGLIHEKCLYPQDIADLVIWLVSRRANVRIGRTVSIQTVENPWRA